MKDDDLLFKVFKAETGAKNDVWKEQHRFRHPKMNKKDIGKNKRRYTIPIALLGKTKTDEKVLLFIQTSTAILNFDHFIIKSDKFTKYLGVEIEYIYVFNTRIGLESELFKNKDGEYIQYGEIKKLARSEIFNSSLKLIKDTRREDIISSFKDGKYKDLKPREMNNLIKELQFSKEENIFRNCKNAKK